MTYENRFKKFFGGNTVFFRDHKNDWRGVKRSLPPIAVKPTSGEIGKSANVIPAQKPKAVEYGNKRRVGENRSGVGNAL